MERLDSCNFTGGTTSPRRTWMRPLDLSRLKEKGKIAHIGVTNFDVPHLTEMLDAGVPVISLQAQYSLLDERPSTA